MADNDLHISITLAGQKDINDLIKKLNTTGGSIDEVAKVTKAMNAAFKATDPGKLRDELGKNIATMRDYNNEAAKLAQSTHAKMMTSYFTLGERLRSFHSVMEMGGLAATKTGQQLNHLSNMIATRYKDAADSGASASRLFNLNIAAAGLGVAGLVVGLTAAIYKLKDFAVAGARVEMLRNQLEVLASKEGKNAVSILGQLTEATGNQVSELILLQNAVQFKLAGTDFAKMPEIFKLAEARADLLGMKVEEVLHLILRAELGAGKRAALALGYSFSMEDAEASYARTLGKTSDKLSENEKRVAFMTMLLEKAGMQQDQFAGATAKTQDSIDRLNTSIDNLFNTLSSGAGILAPVWDTMTFAVNNLTNSLKDASISWTDAVKLLGALTNPLTLLFSPPKEKGFIKGGLPGGAKRPELTSTTEWFASGAMVPPFTKEMEDQAKVAKELADYEKERVVWLQKYWDLFQKTGEQKIAEGLSKRWLGKETKPGKVAGIEKAANVGLIEPMTAGISQAQIAVNSLTDSMQNGFQEATSYLAQGFAQAFGLGNSLLDRMISTFATSALTALPGMIANLLTAGATGNIFTALGALIFDSGGTITEPVAGVGMKSGRPYQIAWNGQPERISPINSVGQAGRYGSQSMSINPSVSVHPIESNSGLAVRVEIGNRTNSRKRIGGGIA
jgi:hypothetical protein